MRMFKVMIIAILSVLLILSGCEKDEVVPIAEKITTDVEQSNEQAFAKDQVEQKENTALKEQATPNQSEQKQQESTENTTNANNTNKVTDEVESTKEPTQEVSTVQKSTTSTTTNKTSSKTEAKETNKSAITTQKTQTNTDEKTTTNESSAQRTEPVKEQTTIPPKKVEPKQTVTISIVGDEQKGTILSATKVDMKEGNTVLDVTLEILKQKGIPISVRGSGSSAYVEGIANLFEFDQGPLSGWTVKRNGTKLGQSSGAIQVKNGDFIQWIYTSNYEEDSK